MLPAFLADLMIKYPKKKTIDFIVNRYNAYPTFIHKADFSAEESFGKTYNLQILHSVNHYKLQKYGTSQSFDAFDTHKGRPRKILLTPSYNNTKNNQNIKRPNLE